MKTTEKVLITIGLVGFFLAFFGVTANISHFASDNQTRVLVMVGSAMAVGGCIGWLLQQVWWD